MPKQGTPSLLRTLASAKWRNVKKNGEKKTMEMKGEEKEDMLGGIEGLYLVIKQTTASSIMVPNLNISLEQL